MAHLLARSFTTRLSRSLCSSQGRILIPTTTPAATTHISCHAHSMGAEAKPVIRGCVFDMDGTLTVPVIDFAYMRQRVGVHSGDILDVISSWPPEEQQRAYAAIAEIEDQALKDMQAMPGLLELCKLLDEAGVPRGLITRNVKRSIHYFHEHHFPLPPFIPALSRECEFPYKPSPAALLHICSCWGIPPSECVMVGDSAKDDVVCGNRAGAVTVLLDTEGRYGDDSSPELQGEARPTHRVTSLAALQQLLMERYSLQPAEALLAQEQAELQQQQQQQQEQRVGQV